MVSLYKVIALLIESAAAMHTLQQAQAIRWCCWCCTVCQIQQGLNGPKLHSSSLNLFNGAVGSKGKKSSSCPCGRQEEQGRCQASKPSV